MNCSYSLGAGTFPSWTPGYRMLYRSGDRAVYTEWGVVIVKNISSFCTKFHIDREAWPGDPIARERIAQPCRIITGPKSKRKACEQPEVASIWRTYGFTKTPSMTNATLAGYLPPTFLFPGCICRTKQTVLSLCLI